MELNKVVHVESPRINIGRRYWIQRLMTKLIEKLSCKNPKTVLIQRMMSPYGRTLLRGFISDSLARLNDSEHCCMMSISGVTLGLCGMLLFERYISNCCLSFVCSNCVKLVWMWLFTYGKNERCVGCQFSNGQYYRDDVTIDTHCYE